MLRTKRDLIRVVIADSSAVGREMLAAMLEQTGDLKIVGTAANGEEAVRLVGHLQPDVVALSIRLPKLNGLAATRQIMRHTPTRIIIVADSLVRSEIDLSMEALQAGALAVANKHGQYDLEACLQIERQIRLMADVPVIHHWGNRSAQLNPIGAERAPVPFTANSNWLEPNALKSRVKIIGIASSTGGPLALATVLGALPADFPLPILIVQHMTIGFAEGLAAWLNTQTPLTVSLAAQDQLPSPGQVLLAPDDYHLQVSARHTIELITALPYKGQRPSANYLFESLARVYGPKAMGIILTGMGDDGVDGLEKLHQAGGVTVAQDENSCVVYGMPGEAVARKAIDRISPLDQIGLTLMAGWAFPVEGVA